MRIDSSGRVGIGVTPSYAGVKLHTYNNGTDAYNIFESSANKWIFGQAGSTCQVGGLYGSHSGIQVTTAGNVGIKNDSPGATLEVNAQGGGVGGYTGFKLKYGTSSVQSLYMGQVTAGNGAFIGTAQYVNAGYWQSESTASSVINMDAGGNMSFYTNSGLTANTNFNISERMRITSGGYVQAGNVTNDTFHEFAQKTTNAQWTMVVRNTTALPYGLLLKYDTSPNNADQHPLYFSDATTARFYMTSNGAVYNNGTYGTISDRKLKENIIDATPKLDDINKLKVRNFNFKDNTEEKHIGFIAQEFEEVFPKAIENTQDRDEDNNLIEDSYTKTIKTSILIPMLVKSIQELKAEVDLLKTQINN